MTRVLRASPLLIGGRRGVLARCLVGAVVWLALCGASTAVYSLDPSGGALALLSLGIYAGATVLLGYLVGTWQSLWIPGLTLVVLDLFIVRTKDSAAGATAVLIWLLLIPIAFLIWVGIAWRRGSRATA
jgi:hypothetical protein